MKYKDFTIHIFLLVAFAFQLIFMISDIFAYGFLSSGYLTLSDILILARFVIFTPLCIYESILAIKYKKEADGDENKHHHHHHRRSIFHRHSHHKSHSTYKSYIKDSDSNRMDEEYSRRTHFMDKEALLKKKEEMRQKTQAK